MYHIFQGCSCLNTRQSGNFYDRTSTSAAAITLGGAFCVCGALFLLLSAEDWLMGVTGGCVTAHLLVMRIAWTVSILTSQA